MTIIEVIFALFIFTLSSVATSFALTSVTLQNRIFNQLQAVNDAEKMVMTRWFAHKPLPTKWEENGVTCEVLLKEGVIGHQEIKAVQIRASQVSRDIWLPVDETL